MFKKLLRDLFDTAHQPRVGFVTEPTALVASPDRRELRRVELAAWTDLAARHAPLIGGGTIAGVVKRWAVGQEHKGAGRAG